MKKFRLLATLLVAVILVSAVAFTVQATGLDNDTNDEWEITEGTVSVTGVTLDKETLTLEVGDTETLTATVAPDDATNKNVSWSSTAEGVATVENGVVTAVSAGTATITVTTEDGEKTATCTVTVKKATVQGDISGDGQVNFLDAMQALRISAGAITATEEQKAAGDVDGNGTVNFLDAMIIMRISAGASN